MSDDKVEVSRHTLARLLGNTKHLVDNLEAETYSADARAISEAEEVLGIEGADL